MTGFAPAWLDLREAADAQARNPALLERLRRALPASARLAIIDLGSGTGANVRLLAPQLGGAQRWQLLDHDPELLAALPDRLARWARALGASVDADAAVASRSVRHESARGPEPAASGRRAGPGIGVRAAGFAAAITPIRLDLNAALDSLELPHGSLVTASALLDLVSAAWLERLTARIARAQAFAYFALSYDGRCSLAPPQPADEEIRRLVNRHQLNDKGFGPALGPAAASHAAKLLESAGYKVLLGASDWRLGAAETELGRALLDGWLTAAAEIDAAAGGRLCEWAARRRAEIDAGALGIVVGHQDLLALPPS